MWLRITKEVIKYIIEMCIRWKPGEREGVIKRNTTHICLHVTFINHSLGFLKTGIMPSLYQ